MSCQAGEACSGRNPCRDGGRCQDDGRECTGGADCSDDGPGCGGSGDRQGHQSDGCDPATVQHGVEAGQGGTFTDSVPALAGGAAFVAVACGLSLNVYKRQDRPTDV